MPTPEKYQPKYPIYILSKGRYDYRHTMIALDNLGVDYKVAIEPQEYDQYVEHIPDNRLVVLPFSNHGKGSGPARNYVWDHSIEAGHKRHWVLDDNIQQFWRFHKNKRYRAESGAIFRAAEDFVDRYENVPLAGFQYKWFCPEHYWHPPFMLNTRLMSCILIENNCPQRWRAKYNEDVDLSIRVLKDGYCTMLFYAFLQGKMRTGILKGGNTDEVYKGYNDEAFAKSKMLVDLHPDCVKLVRRYGRWHHHVDISKFRNNKLILKEGLNIPKGINEYGMKLVQDFELETQRDANKDWGW